MGCHGPEVHVLKAGLLRLPEKYHRPAQGEINKIYMHTNNILAGLELQVIFYIDNSIHLSVRTIQNGINPYHAS